MPCGGFGNATDFVGFHTTQTPTIHGESSTQTFFFRKPKRCLGWQAVKTHRPHPRRTEARATPLVVWSSMRSRSDVEHDAKAVTSIEQLVRACMVRRIPSVPARLVERDVPGGLQGCVENEELVAAMVDFFLFDEKIRNVGGGEYGHGKYIAHNDRSSARLRAGLLGRLYQRFGIVEEQQDDFELVLDTLETEMFRKEVAAAARRQVAEQQAQAQVLRSSPSLLQRLSSMHESPLKQVQSNHSESSVHGFHRMAESSSFAQVRLCSPNRVRGERLSPVQLVCRMYTREAPAEADRPRPRLRSQVRSGPAADGPSADAASRNIRAASSSRIGERNPAPQPVASSSPVPATSNQRAVSLSASSKSTQAAATKAKPPLAYAESPSARPASDGQRSQPHPTSKSRTLAAPVELPAAQPGVTAAASTANAKAHVTKPSRAPAAVPTPKPTVSYVEHLPSHLRGPPPHAPAAVNTCSGRRNKSSRSRG